MLDLGPGLEGRLSSIRLCVLDVDGTLLRSDHTVSEATRTAVSAAQRAGCHIMLASSRGPAALKPVIDALDLNAGEPFIASQGSILGQFTDQGRLETLARHPAPLAEARTVVETALEHGLSVSWYSLATWLVPRVDEAISLEADITRVVPTVTDLSLETEGPDKLMIISRVDEVEGLRTLADRLPPSLRGQFSNPNYLEITAAHVDKGSTLRSFCYARGIEREHVLAVGDGPNDMGLMALAGISAAPANARAEVLAAVDIVTASNDEDGVAQVLSALTLVAERQNRLGWR